MRLTFLGTGTSTGVPVIGCHCEVCRSTDPRDKRLRCSALVETDEGDSLLIDCGPDFRQQILRLDSPRLDALMVTHSHYDHLGGLDDLRPYCHCEGGFPIYCSKDVAHDIHVRLPYCFGPHAYPGSPQLNLEVISEEPFTVENTLVQPLPLYHTPTLRIYGYRIGPLSYITDCKILPDETLRLLKDTDTLIINALRPKEHPSHLNLREALDVIKTVRPRRAFLTHFSHEIGLQANVEPTLPEGVRMAYDGLSVEI